MDGRVWDELDLFAYACQFLKAYLRVQVGAKGAQGRGAKPVISPTCRAAALRQSTNELYKYQYHRE